MSEYVTENFILVDTVGSNILTYTIEELGNDTDYRWVNTCTCTMILTIDRVNTCTCTMIPTIGGLIHVHVQ